MSTLLAIVALVIGLPLVGLAFTGAFNALDRAEPVRPTWAGLRWFVREWWASVFTLIVHPFGFRGGVAVHTPPPWPAEPRPPVLLVPGFALNRSSMWAVARHLRRCGWDWVHIINNEPREATVEQYARELAREVATFRAATGAAQIDLVCHSMGGVVAGLYVNQMRGHESVRRMVTLGTPWHGTRVAYFGLRRQTRDLTPDAPALPQARPPRVPLTSIWSTHDEIVWPSRSSVVLGADHVDLTHIGHLDLTRHPRALRAVAEALATPVEQTEGAT